MLLGGIEGGGTKFVCAVGTGSGEVLDEVRFPTVDPPTTLRNAIDFFKKQEVLRGERLAALGFASFGPVDLNPASEYYGYITTTPKPNWAFTDVVGPVRAAFPDVPVGFDTDVNGAALGEHRWGAAQGWQTFLYFTVGTGIGGGGLVNGTLLHGLLHPEIGHLLLPRREDDPLPHGVCPFHKNCLEGLANGPSLAERWGQPGETLPPDHAAWDLEAHYLALAMVDVMVTLSPEGIILGGSVMHQPAVLPAVRAKTVAFLNDYLKHPRLATLEDYIVPPGLGDQAGVRGSLALALDALAREADDAPR